jgi:hypothetical protein
MLLPPRKRDLRFIGLAACFSLSTDQIVTHYTGQGIWARTWGRLAPGPGIPAKAEETRRRLEAERLARMTEEQREAYVAGKAKQLSWWWSAPEGDDWHHKRVEKDRERMQRGESVIGGYIQDALGQPREEGTRGQDKGARGQVHVERRS